ncbi:MAG TPA: fumarylacetoacetate hydrolase family protein [Polyangiaceae bacterium]|jgi:2-keto-4-pentenoate hydratase/2-oxohepta-3-ene-1,7-dioic acid hydratase in catechol pathway|nr:fumarylacetoacetate hydrolase family protein [Polyangiaceae bacterium]
MASVVRYGRVKVSGSEKWARLDGETAHLLDAAPWNGGRETGETTKAAALACPVAPATIFGIGKNYRAHAAEMKGAVPSEPLVFTKTITSLVGPDGTVVLPKEGGRIDYEAELGVVIGKTCRRVPVERALDYVFGYTALCDVTARAFQDKDGQWTRAKGFDTFCPVGPVVVTGIAPGDLAISLRQNGELRQDATTADMVFDVARLVSHLSSFATLSPGDLIATGTPEGVGPLAHGDRVAISIAGIGELGFGVAREE